MRATLYGRLDGQPLFLEDDLAIVARLGSLTVQAVQRSREGQAREDSRRLVEAAAATRASEARFRALLEADPNAVIAADGEGLVIWATSTSADLFGSTSDGLIGRRLNDLMDLPSFDTANTEVRRVQTAGFRADGTAIPVEVALRAFVLDGEPTVLAVVSDSSWREEANAMRDRFVGVLSHELRTPITSIYGGAQVLLKRAMQLDAETRDELLRSLADESERLLRMVENLLTLARVERGAGFFEMRPILIQRVLADVIEHERTLWPTATIELAAEGDLPVISADEDQIAQIVRNLLANAVKYAGETARIQVAVRNDAPWVAVDVTDDGPGFDEDEAEQLVPALLPLRSTGSRAGRRDRAVRVPAARPGHGRHHHGIEGPGRRSEVHVPAPPARRDRRGLGPPGLDRPGNRRAHRRFDGRRPLTGTGPGLRATLQACSDTTSGRP